MKLPVEFYQHEDTLAIARSLLGKYLYTDIDDMLCGGMITEAEAYLGVIDKASHAFGGRLTNRTKTMYERGGIAYVYLCYGIHEMFNVVTSENGIPHAILIRAIEPLTGINFMLKRRNMSLVKPQLTAGPGAMAQALGISRKINGFDLTGETIWLESESIVIPENMVAQVPRVGVQYAAEDAHLPYRFYIRNNPFVSKPNR